MEEKIVKALLILSLVANAFFAAGWMTASSTIGYVQWQRSAESVISQLVKDINDLKIKVK